MTTTEAVKSMFSPDTYDAIRKHSSPPELLKMACLACFMNPPANKEIKTTLRSKLKFLTQTGLYSE